MPSPNIEVVRRGVAAWARGDIDAMLAEYDPDVEITDPERVGAGPFRGHDAFRRWFAEWLESWDEYGAEIEALVDVGDHVVLFQQHVGRAKGSGIALNQRGALLVGLRAGKIVLHRPFTHRADALEAAGLEDGEAWRTAIETILAGYDAWEEFEFAAVAFTPFGAQLLVDLDVRGKARGIQVEEQWAHLYTLDAGRVARFESFPTREEALEALAYPDRP